LTAQQCWYTIARFGGYLGRKGEGHLAGKPCGAAGSTSKPCSKAFISLLDFLSTFLLILEENIAANSQGTRKGHHYIAAI